MKNNAPSFIKQKLKLLSLNPEFQKNVFIFRKKWKIPKDGLVNDKVEKWWKWMTKISDDFMEGKIFNNKRVDLKRKLKKHRKTKNYKAMRDIETELKNLNSEIPINNFGDNINLILKKYNLSDHYNNSIKAFLLINNFHIINRDNVRVWWEEDKENKTKKKIYIEIYAETTIKDIRKVWHIIERFQENTIGYKEGRKTPKKLFDRDIKIYELHKARLRNPEISSIIKQEFSGRTIMYDEVAKIVQRMKKKIRDT